MTDKSSLKAATAAMPAIITRRGFSDELTLEDRRTLRAVVRKTHRRYFADQPTDAQCDQLIDALGPRAQIRMIAAYHGEKLPKG